MQEQRRPDAPGRVDLREIARRSAVLEGEIPLSAMPRLASALCLPSAELSAMRARWSVRGGLRRDASGAEQEIVDLAVQAELPMTCQRCLQPSLQPVDEEARFRLVDVEPELTLDELEAEDEALCASAPVDLAELVEDQLVLALPLVPMHLTCPLPIARPAQELPPAESPFAALAAIRRRN